MLTVLVNGHRTAVKIVEILHLLHVGVGVPTQDDINVTGLGDDGVIIRLAVALPAKV